MPTILLFHHVKALTTGVAAFAGTLRAAGHTVHVPDLLDGQRFGSITEGVAYVQPSASAPSSNAARRPRRQFPGPVVTIGMSLGVMPAQAIAQTRPDTYVARCCCTAR